MVSKKPIGEEEARMIIADIQNGMIISEVQRKYHHNHKTIKKLLDKYDVDCTQQRGRRRKLKKEQCEECIKLYSGGG